MLSHIYMQSVLISCSNRHKLCWNFKKKWVRAGNNVSAQTKSAFRLHQSMHSQWSNTWIYSNHHHKVQKPNRLSFHHHPLGAALHDVLGGVAVAEGGLEVIVEGDPVDAALFAVELHLTQVVSLQSQRELHKTLPGDPWWTVIWSGQFRGGKRSGFRVSAWW